MVPGCQIVWRYIQQDQSISQDMANICFINVMFALVYWF